MKKYKFVLCPQGNGIDTHRIWEALLAKVVPVIIENDFSRNLKNLGIPVLILKNWDELDSFTEDYINETYMKFEHMEFEKFISLKYWVDLIKASCDIT